MTDKTIYRNVSLSHSTHQVLLKLSKELIKPATLSIAKTVEKIVLERYIFIGLWLSESLQCRADGLRESAFKIGRADGLRAHRF